jgi:serine/threonine protein kinase
MPSSLLSCPSCHADVKLLADSPVGEPLQCPRCGYRFLPDASDGGNSPSTVSTSGHHPARRMRRQAAPRPSSEGGQVRTTPSAQKRSYDFLRPPQRPEELGRLGAYRVLKLLGQGGMGLVFQAEDLKLRRQVALKIVRPEYASLETSRKRFLREAEAQAAIEHDHIVTIFQAEEDNGVPFIAMPLLRGESLAMSLRREKRLPPPEIVRIGQEIADGLAAAHERNLIHRDIKPANVWLEGNRRRVKILDFGLALAVAGPEDHALTPLGIILGTVGYVAPEVGGAGPIDARSDLFSLGCVLYQMATGELPFAGSDMISHLKSLAMDEPRPVRGLNREIPEELEALILQLLAKKPEDRPASAQETAQSLQKLHQQLARRRRPPRPAPVPEPAELANPYEFAASATKKTFKGREDELGELVDSIRSGTHTVIFGLQRMGKTSLIKEGLQRALEKTPRLKKEILLVRIDLQGLGGDQVRYRDLVHAIIEAITTTLAEAGVGRGLADLRALTHELFSASQFQRGDRTQFFSMFARLLRGFASAAHRRIVLFIDEFSEVRKVIERNSALLQHNPVRTSNMLAHDMYLDVPFIYHLGSLLKDRDLQAKFTLIVLVRPFMAEYDQTQELQMLKLMKPIMLYYLDPPAACALITEPLRGQIKFDEPAVERLLHLTAGHPYLLQFMLKVLVDRITRDGGRMLRLDDVSWLEKRMTSEGPAYDAQFEVLISDYSVAEIRHPKEALLGKGALALVAMLGQDQPDHWVSEKQIFDRLTEHKVPPEKTDDLLSQLTRTKILEQQVRDGRVCYRVAVPLLHQRLIQQNVYLRHFSTGR